jgi:crotonobetainyl-CoA:carnitine CoA-transferase CaiB-like acyl-CoA transferase
VSIANDWLRNCRVLDVSQFIPGPYAGRILADLGATVVKVEPPGGDPFRQLGRVDSDGFSAAYKAINRGKTIVELDLKSQAGAETFESLVGATDVLIESFRPGAMDRLGFSSRRLKSLNANLIHCAISGWGQSGPYRGKPGHDINYMALGGGLLYGGPRERPAVIWPPVADFASSQHAAIMILAAMCHRRSEIVINQPV